MLYISLYVLQFTSIFFLYKCSRNLFRLKTNITSNYYFLNIAKIVKELYYFKDLNESSEALLFGFLMKACDNVRKAVIASKSFIT